MSRLGHVYNIWEKFHSMSCEKSIRARVHFHFTWFPKTPIAVAVDTSFGPNHTAARRHGMPRMKIWAMAQIVCANINTANLKHESYYMRAFLVLRIDYKNDIWRSVSVPVAIVDVAIPFRQKYVCSIRIGVSLNRSVEQEYVNLPVST